MQTLPEFTAEVKVGAERRGREGRLLGQALAHVKARGGRNSAAQLLVSLAADLEWARFLRSLVCCDEPHEAVAMRERARWRQSTRGRAA